jgi:hypothetical protein
MTEARRKSSLTIPGEDEGEGETAALTTAHVLVQHIASDAQGFTRRTPWSRRRQPG